MGMAFTDTLLTETNASVMLVDRHHRAGGHCNNAHPFVRLHQPSLNDGVNSCPLGRGNKDLSGLLEQGVQPGKHALDHAARFLARGPRQHPARAR